TPRRFGTLPAGSDSSRRRVRLASAVQDFLVRHPGYRHRPAAGYSWAILCVGVALGVRLVAGPMISDAPFITFFPAVVIATFVAGRAPGFVAVGLGGLAAWYF